MFLLPTLRERLGISRLHPEHRARKNEIVFRELIAFAFPYNLERLFVLAQRLKESLLRYYPEMVEFETEAKDAALVAAGG